MDEDAGVEFVGTRYDDHDTKIDLMADVGPLDVICGQGRGNARHAGNRRMLADFRRVKALYDMASKKEKTRIGQAIVKDILRSGGRFLRPTKGGWAEVDEAIILRKVCKGIRNLPSNPVQNERELTQQRDILPNEGEEVYIDQLRPGDMLCGSQDPVSEMTR